MFDFGIADLVIFLITRPNTRQQNFTLFSQPNFNLNFNQRFPQLKLQFKHNQCEYLEHYVEYPNDQIKMRTQAYRMF